MDEERRTWKNLGMRSRPGRIVLVLVLAMCTIASAVGQLGPIGLVVFGLALGVAVAAIEGLVVWWVDARAERRFVEDLRSRTRPR